MTLDGIVADVKRLSLLCEQLWKKEKKWLHQHNRRNRKAVRAANTKVATPVVTPVVTQVEVRISLVRVKPVAQFALAARTTATAQASVTAAAASADSPPAFVAAVASAPGAAETEAPALKHLKVSGGDQPSMQVSVTVSAGAVAAFP